VLQIIFANGGEASVNTAV